MTGDRLRMREGDQVLPTPHPHVTGTHDLIIADLSRTDRLVTGAVLTQEWRLRVMQVLVARRDIGLQRYGSALQPYNGRDVRRDAVEEAADLVAYLYTGMREGWPWSGLYDRALALLVDLVAEDAR